jgi:hypothetical protein
MVRGMEAEEELDTAINMDLILDIITIIVDI